MVMSQIAGLLLKKKKTISFEVFPTNTPEAHQRLLNTLQDLCALKPDFISCTYGAGGGNREKTLDVVEHIQKKHSVPAMAHLTCVLNSRLEIESILRDMKTRGICNILALRGDPPKGQPVDAALTGDFKYSSELVSFIRFKLGSKVSIGVAGFPEKHLLAPDLDSDARYLKNKIDAGADFVITQLFFDNERYSEYLNRLKKIGVQVPVLPGILPITDYGALKRFCERCGANIPDVVHRIFSPLENNPEQTLKAGIEFAVKQCQDLLKRGAPGLHFYTLNKLHPVQDILESL
jgi:methylenetetrahydrofolate reductase (NADPH)